MPFTGDEDTIIFGQKINTDKLSCCFILLSLTHVVYRYLNTQCNKNTMNNLPHIPIVRWQNFLELQNEFYVFFLLSDSCFSTVERFYALKNHTEIPITVFYYESNN